MSTIITAIVIFILLAIFRPCIKIEREMYGYDIELSFRIPQWISKNK